MKLYELSEQYVDALDTLEGLLLEGEIDQEAFNNTMEGLEGEVKDKAVNVALHIKNIKSDIEQLAKAKKEFEAKQKSKESQLEFYTQYLDFHMRATGLNEVGNEYVTVKYRKLPDVVECAGAPPEYSIIVPESSKPDKVRIKEAIQSGVELPFARLITGRLGLSIK